ncbi:putative lipoprotein [Burkholderia multivorans CF2]|nr:putative lipoprotein [Burkholderia multivorans CF2]
MSNRERWMPYAHPPSIYSCQLPQDAIPALSKKVTGVRIDE